MKLRNIRIGTQLWLGLGVILVLVLGSGAFTWRQMNLLGLQTQMLYDHPFQVNTAVGELEADILAIHLSMQSLMLDQSEQALADMLKEIQIRRTHAAVNFDILFERYLGPRSDITLLQDGFAKWNISRDETRELLQAGMIAEARERMLHGVDHEQMDALIGHVQRVENFARSEGEQFHEAATEQSSVLRRHLAVIIAVIFLLSLIVGGLLHREIKLPLAELTLVAKQFRQGRLDVRSQQVSGNEFGTLAAAFNTMAEDLQTQTQVSASATQLAAVMLREEEAHAFCRELLQGLFQHTGSQVGAVYFLNEAQSSFEHFESIGMGTSQRRAFSATHLEGELGAVLATRSIHRITDIPADTRFTFAAVSGDFVPREILTIPVVFNQTVVAIISLASVHAYSATALLLVDEIWSVLTARVNGVLAYRKIQDFAVQLAHQNHDLESQQRELAAQTSELTGQNTELQMQKLQLNEANRLKNAFLSNMSHELRTPLNSVIALSGVLSRRLANTLPEEEHGYLEVIERNGKNLLQLINNILDLSRIEAGREDINISRFDPREWIGHTLSMLEPVAREKGITLINRTGDELPPLTSDLDKCQHILQNLVANAVKFTESGAVDVSGNQNNDTLEVTVRDTGIGIDAKNLPYIFDEFRQADDSTSRRFGGSGLGLAIARKYALLLGGDITVASTPGNGSVFTLRLPLRADRAGNVPTTECQAPVGADTGGKGEKAGLGARRL